MSKADKIIGIIPSGGLAARVQNLPFSKELIPIAVDEHNQIRISSSELIGKMITAEAENIYFVLNHKKMDVIEYYSRTEFNSKIAFIIIEESRSLPHTIDYAYSFIKNSIVLFGFPDIIFNSINPYEKLIKKLKKTKCDLVLGLFPVRNPNRWDMIDFSENGNINNIINKPSFSKLKYTWLISAWNENFTQFISDTVLKIDGTPIANKMEYTISNLICDAIKNKIKINYEFFEETKCIDLGTYDDLKRIFDKSNSDYLI